MTDEDKPPVLRLSPLLRGVLAFLSVGLAGVHFFFPTLPVDGILLGLLGFAGFVMFFDVQSFQLGGITAARRLENAQRALDSAAPPEPALLPPPPTPATGAAAREQRPSEPTSIQTEAPLEPLERFLWAVEQIRIELTILAGNYGRLPERTSHTALHVGLLLKLLAPTKALTPELAQAIRLLWQTRSEIAHGASTRGRLTQAADSLALDVLNTLRSIPRDYTRIREPEIELFRDEALTQPHDATGVMLAKIDASGKVSSINVYPKRREYSLGQFVTWEWDLDAVFREPAWYKDPDTEKVHEAFSQSATFTGRPYPPDWGLEYKIPDPDAGLQFGR